MTNKEKSDLRDSVRKYLKAGKTKDEILQVLSQWYNEATIKKYIKAFS